MNLLEIPKRKAVLSGLCGSVGSEAIFFPSCESRTMRSVHDPNGFCFAACFCLNNDTYF